ncbi:Polysaccharide biosynthesis protein [Stieleria neptunia]|uniref:Polysaccharide biosynthesis protein n=1 Tax=Stieleria neptunia TaxID=2527979 RepID=A0A518HTQ9_9BACT|nr:polysaccharide biosynthesis C-terminal domain-containing protein [Stieleria neptunia]QDV44204.1 Polysaccharide biosynthesis protein [Stieleria neptunia]
MTAEASPKRRLKTLLDTLAYGIQGVLPQLLSLLLLPVLTRVLTKADYGIVNLVATFSAIASGFIALQLPSVVGRFFFDYEEHRVARFFSTILIASCSIGIFVFSLLWIFGDFLVALCYPKSQLDFFPYFFLAAVATYLGVVTRCCGTLLQVQRKATTLLASSAAVAIFQAVATLVLVVWLRWGPLGVFLATALSAFFNVLVLLFLVRSYLKFQFDVSILRPCMSYCLPLIPHFFGAFLYTSSDILILERYTDLAAVGVYGIAVRLTGPLRICVDAFNRANSPQFMKRSSESKPDTVREYRQVITKWTAVMLSAWVLLSLFANEALTILVPPEFYTVSSFIPILAASYVFRGWYCFAVQTLFYEKQTRWIPIITLSSGVVNVVLNIALIPVMGAIAAAWTTLIAFALSFLIAWVLSNRSYALDWNAGNNVAMTAIAVLTVALSELVFADFDPPFRLAIKLVSMAMMSAWFFHLSGILRLRQRASRHPVES